MTKPRIAASLVAVALAIAGCGGDDDSNGQLSYEEFGTELDSLCNEFDPKLEAATQGLTEKANAASARALGKTGDVAADLFSQAEELEAPDELQATFDELLAKSDQQLELTDDAQAAAEAGDQKAYDKSIQQVSQLDGETDSLLSELGAADCAAD